MAEEPTVGAPESVESIEEDVKELEREEPEKEEPAKEEEKEEGEEETKDEEPEEEKEEEQEEEPSRYPRPSMKAVREKYPNFFKDFPQLRDAIFREQAYTDLFATVDDAKEAAEKVQNFDALEKDITSGNPETLIVAVKEMGAEGFFDKFLPTLYNSDEKTYYRVVMPVIKGFINSMHKSGKANGNENLANSALHAMKFAGIDDEKAEPKPDPEIERQRKELETERNRIATQRFQDNLRTIGTSLRETLNGEVGKSFLNEKASPYLKRTMTNEIIDRVGELMNSDEKHLGLMDSLWNRAAKENYSASSLERIKSAWLSRARALMPAIRREVRNQALGVPEQKESTKEPVISERSSSRTSTSGVKLEPKKIDWSKTSDLDVLNDRVTLRR